MFEVQAGKGPECMEFFSSVRASDRRTGFESAQRLSSTAANFPIHLFQLENIERQLKIQFAAAVANSYYSVKMSVGHLCKVPAGGESISSVSAARMKAFEGPRFRKTVLSSHSSDERGLNRCR